MDVIWIGAAFVLGLLFSRLQLPPLIGYLSAGLALAAYGYEPGPLLEEIAHLGVLFLLFSVGLHIRLRDILRPEAFGSGLEHLILFPAAVWIALGLI
jgi:predicted Kef-type K+ transport protein